MGSRNPNKSNQQREHRLLHRKPKKEKHPPLGLNSTRRTRQIWRQIISGWQKKSTWASGIRPDDRGVMMNSDVWEVLEVTQKEGDNEIFLKLNTINERKIKSPK